MLKHVSTHVSTIAIVALLASATACIFDSGGDYKGGGRKSQGFEEIEQDAGADPNRPQEQQPGQQAPQDSGGGAADTGGGPG